MEIGRAIHYRSYGTPIREDGTQAFIGACRAAQVTELPKETYGKLHGTTYTGIVGLHVVNPTGQFFHSLADGGCTHDNATFEGGTWHYLADCPNKQ
jgi:hypothetical protein